MTHQEKVACFERMLKERGYWVSNAVPPFHRLMWRLGVNIPPPYFSPFFGNFLFSGLLFGVLWGTFMSFLFWQDKALSVVALAALGAGVLFGFGMASFWRFQSKALKLPPWNNFPEADAMRPE